MAWPVCIAYPEMGAMRRPDSGIGNEHPHAFFYFCYPHNLLNRFLGGYKAALHKVTMRILHFLPTLLVTLPITTQAEDIERHDGHIYTTKTIRKPSAADDYISLYQRFLSPARGSRCAMYPSCSNYGLRVFSKKPFFVAMAMTADRMIRCGHDSSYYPLTYEYGYASLIDMPPFDTIPARIIYHPRAFIVDGTDYNTLKNDSLIGFIHNLINSHHYQTALLEIERIGYFHPELKSKKLYLQKMLCYDGLDREEEGLLDFYNQKDSSYRTNTELLIQAAKMYGQLSNWNAAFNTLSAIKSINKDTLFLKYLYSGIAALHNEDEKKAAHYIKQSAQYAPDKTIAAHNLQLVQNLKTKRPKKTWLAGLLSIIPGGGYIYNRQPASAITSFAVNGLLAYATYTSIKRKNYGIAGLTGVFSITFYAGNLFGSIKGTKRYNHKRTEDIASTLEKDNHIFW